MTSSRCSVMRAMEWIKDHSFSWSPSDVNERTFKNWYAKYNILHYQTPKHLHAGRIRLYDWKLFHRSECFPRNNHTDVRGDTGGTASQLSVEVGSQIYDIFVTPVECWWQMAIRLGDSEYFTHATEATTIAVINNQNHLIQKICDQTLISSIKV